ncbi:PAS domain S-box protein [Altererythrobacter fulvus]|uniref:hybrid sensor histidine kinase/response regulator n=1 Tax=Caenibius fulvus TaxID=2126012 RepID=UPI0030176935
MTNEAADSMAAIAQEAGNLTGAAGGTAAGAAGDNPFMLEILRSAIDCIVVADEEGRILYFNPAAEETFGWLEQEVRGQLLDEAIIPHPYRAAHRAGMARLRDNPQAMIGRRRVELEGLRRDGSVFPVELALTQIFEGGRRRIVAFMRDLTEQRRIAAEREQAMARFEAFFRHAPATMSIRNTDGALLLMNDWVANRYGLKRDDVPHMGTPVLRHEDEARARAQIRRVIESGEPQVDEYEYHLPGGPRLGQCTVFPIRDPDGKVRHVGEIVVDISEERKAQADLVASRESLYQAEKLGALGQLLAGVSHELNNPLAIVVGRAAMLKDQLAGTPQEASIDKLRAAAERCGRIVKTFLAMARQSGPQRSLVQLTDLIEAALDLTEYGLASAGIEVSLTAGEDLPLTYADGDQIVQVLINLFVNAQHAMEGLEGEKRLEIEAGRDPRSGALYVLVRDTGPGVDEGLATRIFDPFFTTKDVGTGTGMGLPVSRGMIEAQGGVLELAANGPEGACFRIVLPVLEHPGDTAQQEQAVPAASRGRVLIVDDEPEIAEMLAECLEAYGLTCEVRFNALAALTNISARNFDVVVTDLKMPGMDGIAFHRELARRDPVLARKMIFVSGDVLQRERTRAQIPAGHVLLEKPFDPVQVWEEVKLLIDGESGQ